MTNVFEINNERYTLNVSIFQKDGSSEDPLLVENVRLIQYSNEMGILVNQGTLEYFDTDSRIDKYIQQQYVYCSICFTKLTQTKDGDIVVDTSPDKLNTVFFVDNISILENSRDGIKYKLILVSRNNFEVRRYCEYSNYKDGD